MKKPTTAPTGAVAPGRTPQRTPAAGPPPRVARRLDSAVKWSLGLFLVSFPLMLVWIVLITEFVTSLGVDLRTNPAAQGVANLVYVVLVLSTLLAAAVIGLVGWRRRRRLAALVVAILSVLTALAFVVFPALAG